MVFVGHQKITGFSKFKENLKEAAIALTNNRVSILFDWGSLFIIQVIYVQRFVLCAIKKKASKIFFVVF